MLIDIDKIIVGDRIRKDFGDIDELAEDIRENGLINPPTVNKDYVLLAGERRLKACKSLGWTQIEVHMLDTRDEAHDLAVEMSENNLRRNFTGSELAAGIRRQMEIEAARAKERQAATQFGGDGNVSTTTGAARDKAGEAFGISGKQAERVVFVDEHKDLLDPADFADWDEGKLSTNKAFQRIKAAQAQAERERNLAERERDQAKQNLAEAYRASELMESEVQSLRRQVAEKPKPEVVEREVVRQVVPEDYEELKRRLKDLEHDSRVSADTNKLLRKERDDARKELDKARDLLGMDKTMQDVRRDVQYLTTATTNYVRRYGGLTWTAQSFSDVDATTREELTKAVRNLATFANTLMSILEEVNNNGR